MADFRLSAATASVGGRIIIGDSITQLWPPDLFPEGWLNRGIGGDTTAGVLMRLPFHLQREQPSKVALLIGINDITVTRDDGVTDRYAEILSRVLDSLPPEAVTVISLLPTREGNGDVDAVNADLRQLCTCYGVRYADVHPLFETAEGSGAGLYRDNVHPSRTGYAMLLLAVRPYLK